MAMKWPLALNTTPHEALPRKLCTFQEQIPTFAALKNQLQHT
jgi:hypothetical protein